MRDADREWGERSVGVPTALGHGVMEMQKLEARITRPAAAKVALPGLLPDATQAPNPPRFCRPSRPASMDRWSGSFQYKSTAVWNSRFFRPQSIASTYDHGGEHLRETLRRKARMYYDGARR
jgi:hypothetical protein